MVYIKSFFIILILLLTQSQSSITLKQVIPYRAPSDVFCNEAVFKCADKIIPKTFSKATMTKRILEILNSNRNSKYEAVKKCVCSIKCKNIFSDICNN